MKNNYLSTYFAKSSDLQYTKTYLRKLLYGVQYKQVCFYRCSVWLSVGISMHIFFSVGLTKILPREWAREIAIIQVTILKANFITKKIINLFQELLLKINFPILKKKSFQFNAYTSIVRPKTHLNILIILVGVGGYIREQLHTDSTNFIGFVFVCLIKKPTI